MAYLFDYLLFLAQAVTIVVAIGAVAGIAASFGQRKAAAPEGHLDVRKINDRLDDLRYAIEDVAMVPDALKRQRKAESKARKSKDKKTEEQPAGRVFVIDFTGDLQASKVDRLRAEITAILTVANASDEVVVRLESPGGLVHAYGLAASQLTRLRKHEVPLVVAIDKVAASGGYLMAAVADRVLAAPFALVGSIGVVAQVPNLHRLLKKHDVDFDVITAGRHKRTLTVFGENTEEGRAKFVEELEDTHKLFQEFVGLWRPTVDLDEVSTGEAWYGERAIQRQLVDEIATSDEYIVRACKEKDVLAVRWVEQRKPIERLLERVEGAVSRVRMFLGRQEVV